MIVNPEKFEAAAADSEKKHQEKLKLTEGETKAIRSCVLQYEAAKAQAGAWQIVLEGYLQALAQARGILPVNPTDKKYMINQDFTAFQLQPEAPKVELAGMSEMKHVAAQADSTKKLTVV